MDSLHILASVAALSSAAAAVSTIATFRSARLVTRLSNLLRSEETNEDLRERIETAYERMEMAETRLALEVAESAAYRETLERLGEENAALRREMAELREERDLVETELLATKLALEAEERQADTWARTAATLGFTATTPAVAALGAAA